MWNLWERLKLKREDHSLCDACVVTNVSTASHNVSANGWTFTLTCARLRATACGGRVAQLWSLWGSQKLERAHQSLCDVCVKKHVSIASRNFSATR